MTDDTVRIFIYYPHQCEECLSRERDFLNQRLPGKFKESGADVSAPEIICFGNTRRDIFIRVSGLSAIPHLMARHAVIRLIEFTTRHNVGDESIPIVMVDEDDIERLRNTSPKFASIENAQPLLI